MARGRPERQRTASELQWLRVNAYLRQHRHELAVRAAGGYPAQARVAGTPLLAEPSWVPQAPVPLDGIRLTLRPDAPSPRITDAAGVNPALFPQRPDGTAYHRHSDVIRELAAPAVFENRSAYRLTAADLASGDPHLAFTLGRYFDGVDVGGAAAHEYAAHEYAAREDAAREDALDGPGLPGCGKSAGQKLRAAVADPRDLAARPAVMAVSALTLRHDRAAGTASFPLHYRDPAQVAHAGGMYQVIPVGIFQPSGEAPWNVHNDFSLWRGMLREYAEELLGRDEDHGSESAPIDYANWPFARRMTDALAGGQIRAWCLGLGTDPLTFAMDLLTVVVIDAPLYDELFGDAVSANAEGTVASPRPFSRESVSRMVGGHPVQAAGAALLTLAIAHANVLLGPLPSCLPPDWPSRLFPEGQASARWPRVTGRDAGPRARRHTALAPSARGEETMVRSGGRVSRQPPAGHAPGPGAALHAAAAAMPARLTGGLALYQCGECRWTHMRKPVARPARPDGPLGRYRPTTVPVRCWQGCRPAGRA